MEWSPQQAAALAKVKQWLNDPDGPQVFRLFGYAGTGKSTLASHIGKLEHERKRGGYAQFAAFTGKAAVVMRKKGCVNARTLHSILYSSHEKSVQTFDDLTRQLARASGAEKAEIQKQIDAERDNLKQPGFSLKPDALTIWEWNDDYGDRLPAHTISLFIIDECSMVDARLGGDLLSFKTRVLVLGDPAQLPPVYGAGFFTNQKPDVLLTEIHRQALDSPIIKMASKIRSGGTLDLGDYGQGCSVVPKEKLTQNDWMTADQILVGSNRTRAAFNARVRALRGFSGFLPMPGEKLVCLRNNHEQGLLNGSLWTCIESVDDPKSSLFKLTLQSLDEEGRTVECIAHKAKFMGEEIEPWERRDANEFEFGYALTVHKSQGSQWDNVIVYDEGNIFYNSRKEWTYTAITRAAERVTVVRP